MTDKEEVIVWFFGFHQGDEFDVSVSTSGTDGADFVRYELRNSGWDVVDTSTDGSVANGQSTATLYAWNDERDSEYTIVVELYDDGTLVDTKTKPVGAPQSGTPWP